MIAVDTNLIVRLLVADSPDELRDARAVIERHGAWVSRTVLLETAWVLQHRYGHPPETIADTFLGLLTSESFAVEGEHLLVEAIELIRSGMDLADAIHLCFTPAEHLPFYSFDQKFVRIAKQHGKLVENPTQKSS